jgi:hypothetical protein
MSIFSYHLLSNGVRGARGLYYHYPSLKAVPGLIYSERMMRMQLGEKIFSLSRYKINHLIFCAQWEEESCLDAFLSKNSFGRLLNEGWHARLDPVRRWGNDNGFRLSEIPGQAKPLEDKVVAITIAKMKPMEMVRFIKWGLPVEKQVKSHPGVKVAMAGFRPMQVISTFTIWENENSMRDMVMGKSDVVDSQRHIQAMKERNRRDFYKEFTTLRFRLISEEGTLHTH